MQAINFVQVTESIASSGQPNEEDLREIKSTGYETVVNLALSTSDNAIPNEGNIVTQNGMSYVHIPIQWENPTKEQFELFAATMQRQSNNKVWVHCALNMRVSVFLYLYSVLYLNIPEEVAQKKLNEVWQPNEVWSQFINQVKNSA